MKVQVDIPDGVLVLQAPRPAWISQATSEATIGLDRRRYLEQVQAYRAAGGEVLDVGRQRLVELDSFVRWLRRRQRAEKRDGADDLARELGLRVVGGER